MRKIGSNAMLAWVACLLTLGASGDDLNLLRMGLVPVPQPPRPLPLDDPNTDFTAPAALTQTDTPDGPTTLHLASGRMAADHCLMAALRRPLLLPFTDGRLQCTPHSNRLVPLLC
jgi:hypothetical protein